MEYPINNRNKSISIHCINNVSINIIQVSNHFSIIEIILPVPILSTEVLSNTINFFKYEGYIFLNHFVLISTHHHFLVSRARTWYNIDIARNISKYKSNSSLSHFSTAKVIYCKTITIIIGKVANSVYGTIDFMYILGSAKIGSKNLFTTCKKLIFWDFSIVFVIKLVKIAPQERNPTFFFVHRLTELENRVKGLK